MWFSKRSSLLHLIRSLHSKTKKNIIHKTIGLTLLMNRNPPFSIYLHFTQKEPVCTSSEPSGYVTHSIPVGEQFRVRDQQDRHGIWVCMVSIQWNHGTTIVNKTIMTSKLKSQHINWTNSINHSAKASRKYCSLKCTTWWIWNWAFPELQ